MEAAITDQLHQHPARWVVWAVVALIAAAGCLNVARFPIAGLTSYPCQPAHSLSRPRPDMFPIPLAHHEGSAHRPARPSAAWR